MLNYSIDYHLILSIKN